MLLFKIIGVYVVVQIFFGLKIFRPYFCFPFVLKYGNKSETKENKNKTGFKISNQRKI